MTAERRKHSLAVASRLIGLHEAYERELGHGLPLSDGTVVARELLSMHSQLEAMRLVVEAVEHWYDVKDHDGSYRERELSNDAERDLWQAIDAYRAAKGGG